MNGSVKILVVDDDPRICRILHRYLSREGFQVKIAADGREMRDHIADIPPDLILLDLMLPNEDGFSLVRDLRAKYDVPIIMLTGKIDPVDRVVGLELGADDYITKPFDERELLARVRSVLRRTKRSEKHPDAIAPDTSLAHFAGWQLDLKAQWLISPNGEKVRLTSLEFQLLAIFVKRPGQVLNRDTILNHVAKRDHSPYDRSIDVLVGKVRKKIEPDSKNPTFIKTIRGTGYIFTPKVEFTGK